MLLCLLTLSLDTARATCQGAGRWLPERGSDGILTLSDSDSTPVDVMLVDTRAIVREGLRSVIEEQPDLVVVAQAATIQDAASLGVTPDVIVTDIDLADAKRGDVI